VLKHTPADASARVKGQLVEAIVAAMHGSSSSRVLRNVRLPALENPRRKPEIDVLIDSTVEGYPVQIAFECKNEKKKIGTPYINSFVGKLLDVGIPTQQSIFVSASGFTKGALERAKKVGMRTFLLTGLTKDRLSAAIDQAFQAVIHLWLAVTETSLINDISAIKDFHDLTIFYDDQGQVVGSPLDLVWRDWFRGRIPHAAGHHELSIELPASWRNVVDGAESIPSQVRAKVIVYAIVVSFTGHATRHALVDADTGIVNRLHLGSSFDSHQPSLKIFDSEAELTEFLTTFQAVVHIKSRSRLPRIQWGDVLWPPSLKWMRAAAEATAQGLDPSAPDVRSVDAPSFGAMWDPVWHTPMLREILGSQS
jgi:hypothetical protein